MTQQHLEGFYARLDNLMSRVLRQDDSSEMRQLLDKMFQDYLPRENELPNDSFTLLYEISNHLIGTEDLHWLKKSYEEERRKRDRKNE